MTRTIVRRLLSVIPVMAVVAVFVFLLLHLAPGDPAAIMAGDNATPENIAAIRTKLGLDQPMWWQFLVWIGTLLRGDLGLLDVLGRPGDLARSPSARRRPSRWR